MHRTTLLCIFRLYLNTSSASVSFPCVCDVEKHQTNCKSAKKPPAGKMIIINGRRMKLKKDRKCEEFNGLKKETGEGKKYVVDFDR